MKSIKTCCHIKTRTKNTITNCKKAFKYSNPCKQVNSVASRIVQINSITVWFFALILIAWWAHVTVAPELNKNIVFVKKMLETGSVVIVSGGQTPLIINTGDKLVWKIELIKQKDLI